MPNPLSGYLEVANAVESARNSGKWKVTGSAYGYTVDGTHENQAGALLIQQAIGAGVAALAR